MGQLSIKNLYKNYSAFEALKNINLEIPTGEFVVFVGPSGCGKSTLLRTIAGLETISSGEIKLDGRLLNDIEPAKRELAMVFQSYALYPHLSVRENMAYSLKLMKLSKSEIDETVNAAAEKLQLTDYLDRKPAELSGGQRQRVAIGRAIVRNPKVFLFDEPLSNLDAALRVKMRLEISQLNETLNNTTMIYVTHDQVEAMTMADRIVVLRNGEIEQVGTPMQLYNNPDSIFVAEFIGSPKMNIISGSSAAAFDAKVLGIRPEHVEISPEGIWTGQVAHSEQLGADSFIYVDMGREDPFIIRQSGQTLLQSGQTINFSPITEHLHRFDDNGKRIKTGTQ